MLINLWKTETEFSGLPQITCRNHYVAVREIFIEWKRPAQNIVAVLSSSLVDKGPNNMYQQLHLIHQSNRSNYYHSTPTQPIWYKIQSFDLDTAFFQIHGNQHHVATPFRHLNIVYSHHVYNGPPFAWP